MRQWNLLSRSKWVQITGDPPEFILNPLPSRANKQGELVGVETLPEVRSFRHILAFTKQARWFLILKLAYSFLAASLSWRPSTHGQAIIWNSFVKCISLNCVRSLIAVVVPVVAAAVVLTRIHMLFIKCRLKWSHRLIYLKLTSSGKHSSWNEMTKGGEKWAN